MARQNNRDFTLEKVQIRLRNFEGKAGMYNAEGQRNFIVILPDDQQGIDALLDAGIPVKQFKPREDDEPGTIPPSFIKVKVNIDNDPMPRFVTVTDGGKTTLPANQETMIVLDWADIIEADVILNPYNWELSDGKTGVSVYLKAGYFRINEDDLEKKYSNVPDTDSAQKSTINSVSFTPNDPDDHY